MEVLLSLLILLLVIGIIYWIAAQFLPHPIPVIVLVVGVIILLFWLVGNVGELDVGGDGRR